MDFFPKIIRYQIHKTCARLILGFLTSLPVLIIILGFSLFSLALAFLTVFSLPIIIEIEVVKTNTSFSTLGYFFVDTC